MKIGIVSRFLPEKDGIAIYTENLVKNLKNIDVIKIGTLNSNAKYKLKFNLTYFYKKLRGIIKKEKLNVIHFQYIAPWYGKYSLNYPLIKALKIIKIPKIVTLHEVQYSNEGLKNKILEKIEKRVVKYANKIITHTDQQAEFINRKYNTNKAECIYMGVNIRRNNPKKGKNILFFGMMGKGKGLVDLINAKKYLPNYKLKIAGRPVTNDYKKKILKAKKNKEIELKFGWVSEKEKDSLYKWANIMVLPYRWAPYQSAVLHDALSYSIPVVVTKVGAVWEVVDKFKLGEITKPKNPNTLANSITKVFKDYSHYKKGIKQYRKEANWNEIGKKHLNLYKSLLKQRGFYS